MGMCFLLIIALTTRFWTGAVGTWTGASSALRGRSSENSRAPFSEDLPLKAPSLRPPSVLLHHICAFRIDRCVDVVLVPSRPLRSLVALSHIVSVNSRL